MNISEPEIKKLALFFIYSFLDERRVVELSMEASKLLSQKKIQNPSAEADVLMVTTTLDLWKKYRGNSLRGRPNLSVDSGFVVKEDLDLGPWKEFQKVAQEEELLATIWNMIMGIGEDKISSALGLSTGTIRYRVGRAMRKLGGLQPITSGKGLSVVKA